MYRFSLFVAGAFIAYCGGALVSHAMECKDE